MGGSGERSLTLQVEHQQLPARVLVGPVAEGQHGLLQQVGGVDLLAVVVVELAELAGDALLDGEPLAGRVAVEQEHLQEPDDGGLAAQQVHRGGKSSGVYLLSFSQEALRHFN